MLWVMSVCWGQGHKQERENLVLILILISQFAIFDPQKPSLTLVHSKLLLSVNFEVRIT